MIFLTAGQSVLESNAEHLENDHLALKKAIAQYKAILASALDPIVTIDLNGTIHTASDSLHRVFGWQPLEVIGKNINILMPSPHREAHDGYLVNYRQTGQTNILGRTREFEAVRKDGSRFPIELSVSRVDVPGRAEPLFTGIIHDVSERYQLERELESHRLHLEDLVRERTLQLETSHDQLRQADRLASIGTLAAGLGHDMNNVLLPIRARLDAMEASELPARAREQFQAIRRSIAYLQQLSDGLHLLALDPDDAEASAGVTNIAEWWTQVGSLLSKAVPKRIAFNADMPADLLPIAVAPHRLTQAMLNLVVNAGEAIAGEGVVRVWARTAPIPRDSKEQKITKTNPTVIQLGVMDTGEGMSPEVKNHALDPFFTTKKRGLGTGLGLSLVRGVAHAAGGSVEIESELGRGTTVTINFPVAIDRQDSPSNRACMALVSIHDRRAASFARAMLQTAGFVVHDNHGSDAKDVGALNGCRIWIVQPGAASANDIKQFVRSDTRRRVILFGAATNDSDIGAAPGVMTIQDPTDFDLIRKTIGQAIVGGREDKGIAP